MTLNLASLAASIVMLMSTFTMGCGADCESTCEKAREAGCAWTRREVIHPDSPPRPVVDCSILCEDMEAKTEAAGCTSEHDEYISCLNDQHNVCELEPCSSESIRLSVCILSH
ncbi:hypothetical protein WME91_19775 [Sorangium sp. So ce269]